jgi:hypothetical protein
MSDTIELGKVIETLTRFLMPPTDAIVRHADFNAIWRPLGPWTN